LRHGKKPTGRQITISLIIVKNIERVFYNSLCTISIESNLPISLLKKYIQNTKYEIAEEKRTEKRKIYF
jgi:hypothetical protein